MSARATPHASVCGVSLKTVKCVSCRFCIFSDLLCFVVVIPAILVPIVREFWRL